MVVALSAVVLIAIVGLALDVGVMYIGNARLRRAVDSAALAAALQFRANYEFSDLDRSATEYLSLNGIQDPNALVQICDGPDSTHTIPQNKCPVPPASPRKLVRVVATGTVQLAFLPVIGINSVPITAEAISETASVDVVLVIDSSESMTWDAIDAEKLDPSVCNTSGTSADGYVGDCHPFDEVKRAAVSFVERLYFPYDRVAVVTFDKVASVVQIGGVEGFSNNQSDIINTIKGLTVYEGEGIYPDGNPSRWYDPGGNYFGLQCPQADPELQDSYPDYPSPAPCTTTNIGAGLYTAGVQPFRQGALWVTILLTDGVANAGFNDEDQYYCPESTWDNTSVPPKCNDGRSAVRHAPSDVTNYDAEDYAYDAADFVALDQNALIFTIGLGTQVEAVSSVDGTKLGELFLEYASDQGSGTYSHATAAELREAFRKIAENILTKLAH